VNEIDRKRNKLHDVFEASFDWKLCTSDRMLLQKLNYIHSNPCKGKWRLVDELWEYPHSSALFYMMGVQGVYPVTNYCDLKDIDLTIPFISEPPPRGSEINNLRVPETGDSEGPELKTE
jgi:hypothetical protein